MRFAMKKTRFFIFMIAIFAVLLVLSSCDGGETAETTEVETTVPAEETEPEDKWYQYCGKDGMTCRNCFHAKMLEKWICQEHRGKQTLPFQSCKDWAGKTHPDEEC